MEKNLFKKNENSKYPFRLVFDVADTHNYKNTPYKLWSIKQEYESEIIDSLEAKFGDISENSSFVDAIITTANNMVMDNIQDYMSSILKYKTGTMLESLSDSEIQSLVYQTTFGSVAYMMLNRCGIDPEKYIDKLNFPVTIFIHLSGKQILNEKNRRRNSKEHLKFIWEQK